jgi:hypothetical protein
MAGQHIQLQARGPFKTLNARVNDWPIVWVGPSTDADISPAAPMRGMEWLRDC